MSIVHQVLSAPDLDEVFNYASARLAQQEPDPNERTLKSWSMKWRREALEHYLKIGWSFIAREAENAGGDPKVVGFFLGQPFLFFRGQTQTLWVEHIEADNETVKAALIEVAVKIAREKHLQRVLFSEASLHADALKAWSATVLNDEEAIAVVKTTKG